MWSIRLRLNLFFVEVATYCLSILRSDYLYLVGVCWLAEAGVEASAKHK